MSCFYTHCAARRPITEVFKKILGSPSFCSVFILVDLLICSRTRVQVKDDFHTVSFQQDSITNIVFLKQLIYILYMYTCKANLFKYSLSYEFIKTNMSALDEITRSMRFLERKSPTSFKIVNHSQEQNN